jgi:hypothetical protein
VSKKRALNVLGFPVSRYKTAEFQILRQLGDDSDCCCRHHMQALLGDILLSALIELKNRVQSVYLQDIYYNSLAFGYTKRNN